MSIPFDWERKRVLVTGAAGFVGRHLVRHLLARGARVYAGTSPQDCAQPPRWEGQTHALALTFDIQDAGAVHDAVEKARPDLVFHLAAVGVTDPGIDPMTALTVNAGGAINLLEALRGTALERMVMTGTCHEYGVSGGAELDPFSAYSASKVAAWAFGRMYWRAHELPVVTVRPFQVYGPGQPAHALIPSAIGAALRGEDFPMTPGGQMRDFVFVDDLARGMMAAAETAVAEGQSLDLGTGTGVRVLEVVEHIWDLTRAPGEIRAGALRYREASAMHLVADADQTAGMTGWRATTPLHEGLRVTVRALKLGSDYPYDDGII